MLVIASGTPKSGSTWLCHIVAEMEDFDDILTKYAHKAWGYIWASRSIDPIRLDDFLKEVDYKNHNYPSKNYFNDEILLAFEKTSKEGLSGIDFLKY